MDQLENVLEVPERHAAILYDTGEYRLYFADVKNGVSERAVVIKSGTGIRNLRTQGLRTCGGVMYQNGTNYVLAHGLNEENLGELLRGVNHLSFTDAHQKPKEVHLCTPNGWADYKAVIKNGWAYYETVIKDSIEEPIRIHSHHRIGNMSCTLQSAAIGKDILDVDDGYSEPIRKTPPIHA